TMANPTPAPRPTRWGFIGSGKMATALVRGMIRSGTAAPGSIAVADPLESARESLADESGATAAADNRAAAGGSDVLVLAVKPQSMAAVLEELRPVVTPGHLIVSIAAGISIARIAEGLGPEPRRVVRVMPNTPALLGEGASAYCLGPHARPDDEA